MEIVVGLDLHRSQITFRTVDLRTGEVQRGRIYPGAREAVREWLERFEPDSDAHFALEGTTGWRFVVEEIERGGFTAHLADPAELSTLRGPKRRAKTDHADCELMVNLLLEGRLPESWIPPASLEDADVGGRPPDDADGPAHGRRLRQPAPAVGHPARRPRQDPAGVPGPGAQPLRGRVAHLGGDPE